MPTLEEMKQKLAEAESLLAAAKTNDARHRYALLVQHWREMIKVRVELAPGAFAAEP